MIGSSLCKDLTLPLYSILLLLFSSKTFLSANREREGQCRLNRSGHINRPLSPSDEQELLASWKQVRRELV